MDKILSCAVIGHSPMRFSWGFDERYETSRKLKKILRRRIISYIRSGVLCFNIVCDCGIGLYSAEIIIKIMKTNNAVSLNCIIPHEDFAAKWTNSLRRRYFKVLENCTEAQLISIYKTNDCIEKAYESIIYSSGALLAVYDPMSCRLDSIDNAVNKAQKLGLPIELIHPDTLKVSNHNPPQIIFGKTLLQFSE